MRHLSHLIQFGISQAYNALTNMRAYATGPTIEKEIIRDCKTNAGFDIWNAATIVMDCRLYRLLLLLRASFASASRIRGISTARHICQVVEGVDQDSWARGSAG